MKSRNCVPDLYRPAVALVFMRGHAPDFFRVEVVNAYIRAACHEVFYPVFKNGVGAFTVAVDNHSAMVAAFGRGHVAGTFLLPFRGRPIATGLRDGLHAALRKISPKSVASLADEVAVARGLSRPEVLPGIWTMVAEFRMAVDLDRPLTMSSVVTPAKETRP